jgi:hypothetical protein
MKSAAGDRSATFADWLVRQALIGLVAGAVLVLVLVLVASAGIDDHPLPGGLLLIATLAALALLALSALLRFDAALFHSMAGKDETDACAEVDRSLAAMRLKPLPVETRPLDARMAGARKLVEKQRIALAVACVATAGAAALLWI